MPTVTINANDYQVYDDIAAADLFLQADFGATAWRAETDADQKARSLVVATRLLNRLQWSGLPTDPDQPLAWPRSGTGIANVEDDEIPQPVLDAAVVIAKLVHEGSNVDSSLSGANDIRQERAGSVSIEYFLSLQTVARLPLEVQELLGPYLASVTISPLAFGTRGESITDGEHSFAVGWPA